MINNIINSPKARVYNSSQSSSPKKMTFKTLLKLNKEPAQKIQELGRVGSSSKNSLPLRVKAYIVQGALHLSEGNNTKAQESFRQARNLANQRPYEMKFSVTSAITALEVHEKEAPRFVLNLIQNEGANKPSSIFEWAGTVISGVM